MTGNRNALEHTVKFGCLYFTAKVSQGQNLIEDFFVVRLTHDDRRSCPVAFSRNRYEVAVFGKMLSFDCQGGDIFCAFSLVIMNPGELN